MENVTPAANIFEVDPYGDLVRLGLLPGTITPRPARRTEPAARLDIEELDVFDGTRPMTAGLCVRSVPESSAGLCVRSIPSEPAALVGQFIA